MRAAPRRSPSGSSRAAPFSPRRGTPA
jgi:hypothetical protein